MKQAIVQLVMVIGVCFAQPEIEWQNCLGGSSDDHAKFIQQTSDGGYIVAGTSESDDGDVSGNNGFIDYWIVKLNSSCTIEWQNCFGGSDWDSAKFIQQTSDGKYIVSGFSYSNDGDVSGNHGVCDYWKQRLPPTVYRDMLNSDVSIFKLPHNGECYAILENCICGMERSCEIDHYGDSCSGLCGRCFRFS